MNRGGQGGHRVKRGNACFLDDPAEILRGEEAYIHEARRKRIRIGTLPQPSSTPISDMWQTSARINAPGFPGLQLDFVNYANQVQNALSTMFGEVSTILTCFDIWKNYRAQEKAQYTHRCIIL